MLLLIFGIYALVVGNFQISRHYGLKGTGARIAGSICIAFALGFFTIIGIPIMIISQFLGMGEGGVLAIGLVLQVIVFIALQIVLVRIFGNAFARVPEPQLFPPSDKESSS
jgi:hypothetical protein